MPSVSLPKHYRLKLQVYNNKPNLGKGVITLLSLIQEGHSLRSATQSMEMAYSKAWRLIQAAEEDLGFQLINKQKGGATRAGSTLTPEGEMILLRYQDFEKVLYHAVDQLFMEYFS